MHKIPSLFQKNVNRGMKRNATFTAIKLFRHFQRHQYTTTTTTRRIQENLKPLNIIKPTTKKTRNLPNTSKFTIHSRYLVNIILDYNYRAQAIFIFIILYKSEIIRLKLYNFIFFKLNHFWFFKEIFFIVLYNLLQIN